MRSSINLTINSSSNVPFYVDVYILSQPFVTAIKKTQKTISKPDLVPVPRCHKQMLARNQRTLTVGGSITVWLVYSFTSLDSAASLHTKNHIFSSLAKSSLVKQETSCTVILPSMVNALWCNITKIKHPNWLKLVMWLEPSNQIALFQGTLVSYTAVL